MAKWDYDGAPRDSAFRELCDLARELETARAGLRLSQVLDLAERCGLCKRISGVSAEAALWEFSTLVREAEPLAPDEMRPAPVAEEADESTQPREQAEERAQVLDALLDKLNSAHSLTLQYPPESQPYREAKARYAVALTDLRVVISLTQQAAPEAPTAELVELLSQGVSMVAWLADTFDAHDADTVRWLGAAGTLVDALRASTGAVPEALVSEQQAKVTDAMVDAYLAAQGSEVARQDRGMMLPDSRAACRAGLIAALATPAATTASAGGGPLDLPPTPQPWLDALYAADPSIRQYPVDGGVIHECGAEYAYREVEEWREWAQQVRQILAQQSATWPKP